MTWSLINILMPDYTDGQEARNIRPEPGRPIVTTKIIEKVEKVENKLDTNAIIEAVIKGVTANMPKFVSGPSTPSSTTYDDFNSSASLDKLADAMTIPKENEGKVDGIGIIKETKKDEKETKKTIDLLSNLD